MAVWPSGRRSWKDLTRSGGIWPSPKWVEGAEPGCRRHPGGATGTHGGRRPNPGGSAKSFQRRPERQAKRPRKLDPHDLVGFHVFLGSELDQFGRIGDYPTFFLFVNFSRTFIKLFYIDFDVFHVLMKNHCPRCFFQMIGFKIFTKKLFQRAER